MLTQLSIHNIVLIEKCEVPFGAGLCVLSGETGAGKSILLDALGLALGARSDASLIRHGEEQASVAAEFDIAKNTAAKACLQELELEAEDTLIIRRSLSRDGKARALVNDQPVSISALKRLGETLVEVSGQHESRGLMDAATHRGLLDEFGRHGALLAEAAEAYRAWKAAGAAREKLALELEQSAREEEYLRHIAKELAQLAPKAGEEEELAGQRTLMMQSEKLFDTLNEAVTALGGAASLRVAQRILLRSTLSATGRFASVIDGLDRAANEADDALAALEAMGREAPYDQEKLEAMEERLFALRAAGRKYNLPVDDLAGLREEAEAKLARLTKCDHEMKALAAAEAKAKAAFEAAAGALTRARKKAGAALEAAVQGELKPLKMGGTRFGVVVTPLTEAQWTAAGVDAVAFMAATNAGKDADMPLSPIAKIASGGELSRFMLAMKVALSQVRTCPTLVFDEIDTGTGGAVADAIGQRLGRLGRESQVLVVTHLPQVAARGAHHLLISKQEKRGKVTTSVAPLDLEARKEELARMLAGSTVTAEARKAAEKLLEQAA